MSGIESYRLRSVALARASWLGQRGYECEVVRSDRWWVVRFR